MLRIYEDDTNDSVDCYAFNKRSHVNPTNVAATVHWKKNLLSTNVLAELMFKTYNVSWSKAMQRQSAVSDDSRLNPDSSPYQRTRRLLEEDITVEVFCHFYPTAEAR